MSLPALTTGVPLEVFAGTAKKRSFLIEILLAQGLDHGAGWEADKLWQSRNDGFRQKGRRGGRGDGETRGRGDAEKRKRRRGETKKWRNGDFAFALSPRPASPLPRVRFLILAGAGGELAGVFVAAAGGWIAGAATGMRLWTTALVAHLRSQSADAMFIQ